MAKHRAEEDPQDVTSSPQPQGGGSGPWLRKRRTGIWMAAVGALVATSVIGIISNATANGATATSDAVVDCESLTATATITGTDVRPNSARVVSIAGVPVGGGTTDENGYLVAQIGFSVVPGQTSANWKTTSPNPNQEGGSEGISGTLYFEPCGGSEPTDSEGPTTKPTDTGNPDPTVDPTPDPTVDPTPDPEPDPTNTQEPEPTDTAKPTPTNTAKPEPEDLCVDIAGNQSEEYLAEHGLHQAKDGTCPAAEPEPVGQTRQPTDNSGESDNWVASVNSDDSSQQPAPADCPPDAVPAPAVDDPAPQQEEFYFSGVGGAG